MCIYQLQTTQVTKCDDLQNGTGHPHQILNEHGKKVGNAESGEYREKNVARLIPLFRVDGHKCVMKDINY